MAALPFTDKLSWIVNETFNENKVEFKTGSYVMEAAYGINPIDEEYSVTWFLPTSSKNTLINGYKSNPFTTYDFTPEGGSAIKVVITQPAAAPIRVDNSYWQVTSTLKRRYL